MVGISRIETSSGDNADATATSTEEAIGAPSFAAAHRQDGAEADPSIHIERSAQASLANSSTNNLASGSTSDIANGSANAPDNGTATSGANSAGGANGSNQSATPSASNPSNASGSSAASGGGDNGNSGAATSGGNGTSTAPHSSDATKSGTAALVNSTNSKTGDGALPSSTPQATGIPHGNSSGSVVAIHGDSSAFLASNHANTNGSPATQSSSSGASPATSSDAFTALDSAATGQRGVLLHAAPNQVSVGVADPSLGWVEVRAERVAGQVTAALAATSSASHAALTSVLPSMATYLQQHQAGVHQVHVETGLSGGQSGTGSQGQPSPQSDANASRDNMGTLNSGTNSGSNAWAVAPAGTGGIAAAQGNISIVEGRRFSIRA